MVLAGLRRTVIVLVAFAAVGALAGVVWEWLWDAPVGFAYEHEWLPDLARGARRVLQHRLVRRGGVRRPGC